MRRATRDPVTTVGPRVRPAKVAIGDYMCSDRDLYRVEQCADGHVLLEDCRTGELIDTPLGDLSTLRRLERS